MSKYLKNGSHQNALRLLIIASAGTAALLVWQSRKRTHRRADASYATPETSVVDPMPGDILLFHNAKGINKFITIITGSPFYHAAMYVGPGRAIEATLPGVGYRKLSGPENSYVVVPAPKAYRKAALAWAESQIGDSYAWLDLPIMALDRFFRFIHFNYTPPGKYTCGEFVEKAYAEAGIRLIPDRDPDDVVPGEFARYIPAAERRQIR